jgi:hypothetical protein
MKRFTLHLVLTWLGISAVFFANTSFATGSIPTITGLSGTAGPAPGQVVLTWHVPLFDNPDPGQSFDYSCEFRTSSTAINNSNWEYASPVQGDFTSIVSRSATYSLTVSAMAYDDGTTSHQDMADVRAWLSVQYADGEVFHPLSGETIDFTVQYPIGTSIRFASAVTDVVGMAQYVTQDLWDSPPTCSPTAFRFIASWTGHPPIEIGGQIQIGKNPGVLTSFDDMILCEGTFPPTHGTWTSCGTVDYRSMLDGTGLTFTVPALSVSTDNVVTVSTPGSIPGPTGMKPGVTGAMVAFQVDSNVSQTLNRPITIAVTYPPEKLNESGCLGESSLRPYIYSVNYRWQLLDQTPVTLNRSTHCLSFQTSQLGLFALAAEADDDCDGIGNYEEYHYGTSPQLADTDGDGISDGQEIWFTYGDPLDAKKLYGNDQHGLVTNLTPGQSYYIAARIVGPAGQSYVSDNVYIANPCPCNPDITCDKVVDLADFLVLAQHWLETLP